MNSVLQIAILKKSSNISDILLNFSKTRKIYQTSAGILLKFVDMLAEFAGTRRIYR